MVTGDTVQAHSRQFSGLQTEAQWYFGDENALLPCYVYVAELTQIVLLHRRFEHPTGSRGRICAAVTSVSLYVVAHACLHACMHACIPSCMHASCCMWLVGYRATSWGQRSGCAGLCYLADAWGCLGSYSCAEIRVTCNNAYH
jgi:hypothetical protein